MQVDDGNSRMTVGELAYGWSGECQTQIAPNFATWMPGFPVIQTDDLAQRQIAEATAKDILEEDGYVRVTDHMQEMTVKFIGWGTVIWLDAGTGVTLWVPRETLRFMETHPVILGFAPPPEGIPDPPEDMGAMPRQLPSPELGTLAMRPGGPIMSLEHISQEARDVQQVLRGLVDHLHMARRHRQDRIETELLAIYQTYQCQLIARYAHEWSRTATLLDTDGAKRRRTSRRRHAPHGHGGNHNSV